MSEKITPSDRISYAAIGGGFGIIIGSLLALLGFLLGDPPKFSIDVLLFTMAIFSVAGFSLGVRSADLVAMCLSAITYAILATGSTSLEPEKREFSPQWLLILLLLFFAVVIYLASR